MGLQLYNSLTRKKEEFEPLEKGKVGMYVCGPTVYGHAHLGHAKSYVSFDILVRYLRYLGYSVTYVQNITDVGHLTDDADEGEDKIAKEAKKEKKHPMALAELYTRSFFEDMDRLNCVRPDISPRASGHIIEQIELVKTLVEKGYAYEVNGSVYFDVSKFKEYGKLSGRNIDEMQAGARVDVSPDKKNPVDFALWKKAEPNHIMQWPSPWGMGYPGWHLECSVMSMKYLGATIDIHGGGLENQFPHHECEIAQSEAANGVPFVRYWLHNNMVTVDSQKMGKSLNNFITLKQAFINSREFKHERLTRKYDSLAVRQLILNTHYRSPIDFSDAALFAAQSGYEEISGTLVKLIRKRCHSACDGEIDVAVIKQLDQLKSKFEEAMNDDLNTSVALSVMFNLCRLSTDLIKETRTSRKTLDAVCQLFFSFGGDVLGIVKVPDILAMGSYDRINEAVIQVRRTWNSAPEGVVDETVNQQLSDLKDRFDSALRGSRDFPSMYLVVLDIVYLSENLLQNSSVSQETLDAVDNTFRRLAGDVLGIVKESYTGTAEAKDFVLNRLLDVALRLLIGVRNNARNRKDFAEADAIREELNAIGIILEDTPEGTTWRMK